MSRRHCDDARRSMVVLGGVNSNSETQVDSVFGKQHLNSQCPRYRR